MENLSQNSRGYIFSLIWHFPVSLALWDIKNLLKTKKRQTKVVKAISNATGLEYENLIIRSCFWDLLVSCNWWFQYFWVSRPKGQKGRSDGYNYKLAHLDVNSSKHALPTFRGNFYTTQKANLDGEVTHNQFKGQNWPWRPKN